MRQLASIQTIIKIEPIEGADFIACASILGWKLVIAKNDFKVGDKCVYFEVDSYLPIEEKFEFLRPSSYKKHEILEEGFRIKTQKLRGQISQGLAMTLESCGIAEDTPVGTDVTELLGVRKWEPLQNICDFGTVIDGLPHSISATDETRVQSIPDIIEEFRDKEYYITTKIDGTSVTMTLKDDDFKICSHTNTIIDDGKGYMYRFAENIEIKEKMKKFGYNNLAIQGEYAGPKIQKNKLQLKEPKWYIFTIVDITTLNRLGLKETQEICKNLELEMVPIEEIGYNLPDKYPTVADLIERAKGLYPSGRKKEGIVIRTTEPCHSKILNNYLSIKVLNNDFLLKEK